MSSKKKVLIITDGSEKIEMIAQSVKDTLTDTVVVCPADRFEGTDLLPVDIFILGCSKSNPASFAYLEEMLAHINLAGRRCGIFSTDKKALKYLSDITKDCEAGMGEPFLAADSEIDTKAVRGWLKSVLG